MGINAYLGVNNEELLEKIRERIDKNEAKEEKAKKGILIGIISTNEDMGKIRKYISSKLKGTNYDVDAMILNPQVSKGYNLYNLILERKK